MSVCIPTYNYGHFLAQAVESVLAQTFEDFELLVLDDASSDDTDAVMAQYAGDPRVTYVRNEHNVGLFANFNSCAQRTSGRYLKFLCADDWLHEDFLADTVDLLERNPDAALATTAGYRVDEGGKPLAVEYGPYRGRELVPAHEAELALARWYNVIGMPSAVLMRRSAFETAGGFDAEFAPAADVFLWLSVLQTGALAYLSQPRCFTRIHTAHTHSYGPDPTEAMFLVWEEAARRPGTNVDRALLDTARYFEAERSLLYITRHLLGLRFGRARAIARYTGDHVSWGRAMPRFLLRVPAIALQQARRIAALRRGRLVLYDPEPRAGPPIGELQL